MANIDLSKYGITGVTEIVYNPSYETLFEEETKPELEGYRKEIGQYITQEEDVLSYALFPQVAEKFFKARQAKQLGLDNSVLDTKNNAMPI